MRTRRIDVPKVLRVTLAAVGALSTACDGRAPSDASSDSMFDAVTDAVSDALTDVLVADASDVGDPTDAARDVTADLATDASCDADPFGGLPYSCLAPVGSTGIVCASSGACDPSGCAAPCRACESSRIVYCRPTGPARADGGGAVACPSAPLCGASECPAPCRSCVSPLFCIPDPDVEADAGVRCEATTVCGADDCPLGCRAVG